MSQCDLTHRDGVAVGALGLTCVGSPARCLNFALIVHRNYIELPFTLIDIPVLLLDNTTCLGAVYNKWTKD